MGWRAPADGLVLVGSRPSTPALGWPVIPQVPRTISASVSKGTGVRANSRTVRRAWRTRPSADASGEETARGRRRRAARGYRLNLAGCGSSASRAFRYDSVAEELLRYRASLALT